MLAGLKGTFSDGDAGRPKGGEEAPSQMTPERASQRARAVGVEKTS